MLSLHYWLFFDGKGYLFTGQVKSYCVNFVRDITNVILEGLDFSYMTLVSSIVSNWFLLFIVCMKYECTNSH